MFELLAPAGDLKCVYAAVNAGADAVYLGLGDFNARQKAENFDEATLKEAIDYAHFFGAKVYVAVNTILQNSELKRALSLVKVAVELNADAFIIQDLGLGRILKSCFENIELHLSTQGGVHNVMGAIEAQKLGFKRVVLSRETRLEDIRAIRRETDLELEFFVQGALCVCFSGNCYMSSREYGASGNRGLCRQLCRMEYEADAGKTCKGYLLSARDISLTEALSDLIDAGVTSFKIEGRMRREGYVSETVTVFRRLIDDITYGNDACVTDEEERRLRLAFSRGEFSKRAYLDGENGDIIEPKFNNHTGVSIGKVIKVKPFKAGLFDVTVTSDVELFKGDGLKFFYGGKEVESLGVGDPQNSNGTASFVTAKRVPVGAEVRLIYDAKRQEELSKKHRYVPVDIDVCAKVGEPLTVTASAKLTQDDGYVTELAAVAWQDGVLEAAKTAPTTDAELKIQAAKTADTGFVANAVNVNCDGAFVAKSLINGLRRQALFELREKMIDARALKVKVDEKAIEEFSNMPESEAKPEISALKVVYGERADEEVPFSKMPAIKPTEYTIGELRRILTLQNRYPDEVALVLPTFASGKDVDIIDALLDNMPELKTLVANNIYGLGYIERGYSVIAGPGLNIANDMAVEEYALAGCTAAVASSEFARPISMSASIPVYAFDEMPVMTLLHCPFKTIYRNDCAHCSYKENYLIKREKSFRLRRIRLSECEFELYEDGKM